MKKLEGNKHINYSAEDIRRYLKGELSPSERHQLEKAALDDPFLADAIEGYSAANVPINKDIEELRERLLGRKESAKVIPLPGAGSSNRFPWLRVAVMLVLLASAGWMVYILAFNEPKENIAKTTTPPTRDTKPTETIQQSTSDTSFLNNTQSAETTDKGTATITRDATRREPVEATIEPSAPAVASSPVQSGAEHVEPQVRKDSISQGTQDDLVVVATPVQRERELMQRKAALETDKQKAAAKKRASDEELSGYMSSMNVFYGRVTDAQNNALPFANITNVKDNVGTYTDAKGNFPLPSPASILDVQIRSLGYENARIALKDDVTTNHVSLREDKSITAEILDTVKRNLSRARSNTMRFEEPEPADGWDYYDTYIVNNINIPDDFKMKPNSRTMGMVELSFEVNDAGEPVNIVVERSLCERCDKEAIRLITEGPKWKKSKGRTMVMVPFTTLPK